MSLLDDRRSWARLRRPFAVLIAVGLTISVAAVADGVVSVAHAAPEDPPAVLRALDTRGPDKGAHGGEESRVMAEELARKAGTETCPAPSAAAPRKPSEKYPGQWGPQKIGAERAWERTRGAGVTIAVIDSSVFMDHPTFRHPGEHSPFVPGWNFGENNDNPIDDEDSHGTFVAALAASPDDGPGISGVAPQARIMPIRVSSTDLSGNASHRTAQAIRWAVDHGADVINVSMGVNPSDELRSAVEYAALEGVPIVAAAGNGPINHDIDKGDHTEFYPGRYARDHPNVISVNSLSLEGVFFDESSYGARSVTVAAPGDRILGPCRHAAPDSWSYFFGGETSAAAPHVSGVVALMLSMNPALSPSRIRDIIVSTATRQATFQGRNVAGGYVNAAGAVDRAIAEDLHNRSFSVRQAESRTNALTANANTTVTIGPADDQSHQVFHLERSGTTFVLHHDEQSGTRLFYDPNEAIVRVGVPRDTQVSTWRLRAQPDQRTFTLQPANAHGVRLGATSGIIRPTDPESALRVEFASTTPELPMGNPVYLTDPVFDQRVLLAHDSSMMHMTEEQGTPWLFEWNPLLAAYRILWNTDASWALAANAGSRGISPVIQRGNAVGGYWIPWRNVTNSIIFLNAEDPTLALSRGDGDQSMQMVERPTNWFASPDVIRAITWDVSQLDCARRQSHDSTVDHACQSPAPQESLAGKTVTLNLDDDPNLAIDSSDWVALLRKSADADRQHFTVEEEGDFFTFRHKLSGNFLINSYGGLRTGKAEDNNHLWRILRGANNSFYIALHNKPGVIKVEDRPSDGAGLLVVAPPSPDYRWLQQWQITPIAGPAFPETSRWHTVRFSDDRQFTLDEASGKAIVWTAHEGENQQVRVVNDGKSRSRLQFRSGGELATLLGHVFLSTSLADRGNPYWELIPASSFSYVLRSEGTGLYLTAGKLSDGSSLTLTANKAEAKQFSFVPVGGPLDCSTRCAIRPSSDPNYVADARINGIDLGARVTLFGDKGGSNQRWNPKWDPKRGAYRFALSTWDGMNEKYRHYLAWESNDTAKGKETVAVWNDEDDDQYWVPSATKAGHWILTNYKDPSQALQYVGQPSEMEQLRVRPYQGDPRQHWTITSW